MKKHRPGFVPIKFKKVGKVVLAVGLALLLDWLIGFSTGWFMINNFLVYLSMGLVLLGLYLVFVVPKE